MTEGKVSKLNAKLKLKNFKLSSLLEVTRAINENYSTSEILEIYRYILKDELGVSKLILFSKGDKWECVLKYGSKGTVKNVDVKKDLSRFKEITVIESSNTPYLSRFDVVIPVYHKKIALAYLLIGDLEDEIKISPTIKHMPFIQTLTNIIMVAIENKRMARETLHQERMKKELEMASEMQALLFPQELPSNDWVDIAAKYEPHHLVGGDYYDYFEINEDEFIFCMADVSGKGVSAALLMSNFQANLRAIIRHTDYTIIELVEELNKRVMESADGEKFITFFIGHYNRKTKKFQYVNAGHNHPLITDGKDPKALDVGTTGLGMFDDLPFINKETLDIVPNTVIACYTDGVVELENVDGKEFGTDRLVDCVHSNYDLDMTKLNELLFSKMVEFKGKKPYFDDTALFTVRIY